MKRDLLACGIVAGPLFVVASLAQAFTRSGFDLGRHPISLLSLGDPGWVQIANFVVSGVLYLAGAVGMREALRPGRGSTWGPLLVGVTGVGLIVAGIFATDAAGFPPGAPAGAQAMSWHGVLHEVGFALSFMGAIAACGVFARRYAALGRRGWAVAAVATVVAVLVIAGWPDLNTLSVRLVTATAALFGFLSVVAAQLFHQACRRCIGWLLPASAFGRSARPGCRWSSRSQGASSASPQLECAQTRRRHGEPASARKGEILRAAMAATHKSGAL